MKLRARKKRVWKLRIAVPVQTKGQRVLYEGISASKLFTLESVKDAFKGVERLRTD